MDTFLSLFSRLATQRAFKITCILRTGNKGNSLTIQSGRKGSILAIYHMKQKKKLTLESGKKESILTVQTGIRRDEY